MTRSEAPGAMLATLHLLTASLAPSLDSLALARPAAEGTLRRQICTYIDERVTQQDLSSELICTRLSKKTCQLNPASVEEVAALGFAGCATNPISRKSSLGGSGRESGCSG